MPLDPNTDVGVKRRLKKNQEQAQAQGSGQTAASGADPYRFTTAATETKDTSQFLHADRLAQGPTIRTDYGIQPAPDYYANLKLLEQHSSGTLPTEVSAYIAGLPQNKQDLIRTAQIIATKFDVSPKYIFGTTDPKKYTNPVTGQPLSLKDAQRFTADFAPFALASMIQAAIRQRKQDLTVGGGSYKGRARVTELRGGGSKAPIKVEDVAAWAKTLSQYGGNLPLENGIAMAVFLASQQGLSRARFKKNVEQAISWYAQTRQTSQGIDDQMVMSIAIEATRRGTTFRSPDDVTDAVFGRNAALNQKFADYLSTSNKEGGGSNYQLMVRPMTIQDAVDYGPDYWSEVQKAADQMQLEQEAFHNSAFGKALTAIGWLGQKSWYATERGLVELGFQIETPVVSGLGYALGRGDAPRQYIQALHADAVTRLNQGEDVGNWVENGYSNLTQQYLGFRLPSYTSTAFDFAVGWYVDPTVVLGKAGRVLRGEEAILGPSESALIRDAEGTVTGLAADKNFIQRGYTLPTRVLPGLDEPTVGKTLLSKIPGVGRTISKEESGIRFLQENAFQTYVTKTLPKSRVANKLYDALYKGNTQYLRELDLLTPGRNVTRSLDYEYMKLVRSKMLELYPVGGAEARKAFSDALTAHFTGFGPDGSIAEWAAHARIDRARGQVQDALARGVIPDEGDTARALSQYLSEGGQNILHLPFTPEAPGRFGFYGPRSLVRRAITSETSTKTAFGKRLAQIPNINPGRVLNMHEADDYMVLHMRRWGAFDENAIRKAQAQIFEAQSRGYFEFAEHGVLKRYGFEDGVDHLINDVNEQGIDYVLRDMNINAERRALLKDDLLSPIRSQNEKMQTFWTVPEGEGEHLHLRDSPLWETQRENFRYVVDPVEIRREIRDYTGIDRRAWTHFKNALGKDAPELLGAIDPGHIRAFFRGSGNLVENAWRFRKRLWKALTVARPGYIPRVILMDENARFMFTTRAVTERLMAQDFWGATRKLGEKGIGNIEFPLIGKTVPLPGAFEANKLATGTLRDAEQAEEILRNAGEDFKKYTGNGSWGPIQPGDKEHIPSWTWALQKQARGSAPGRVALEAVANGQGDVQSIRDALVRWADKDHFVVLTKRIGVSPADFDTWFDDAAAGIHAYTLGRADLARDALTLDGKDLAQALAAVPEAERPIVHGKLFEGMFQGGGPTWGNEFTNGLYKTFVSRPEEILNRNTYYRAMKRRSTAAYYGYLEHQFPEYNKAMTDVRGFVESRVSPTLALEDEAYVTKSIRAAQTLGGKGEDLGNGVWRLVRDDGKSYYYPIENGRVVGFRSVSKDGRVETVVDPEFRNQGIATKLLQAHWRDAGVYDAADPFAAAKSLIDNQQFTRSGAELNIKALQKLQPDRVGLPSGIDHAVDVASTQFALDRVRAVMFDLTRQSRFTELLQIVFPFPQPFFEGFQTWGAIAMRHPETLGRTAQLFRTGVQSGFIRKDPVTGEYVVPMGAFRWLAGASWALSHGDIKDALGGGGSQNRLDQLGIGFVAPLSSFNLLAASTIKFSGSTPIIGKLVGGVPIPAPGLDPAAAIILQGLFKDSKSIPATSYLFQYGPSSAASLIPNSVKGVLSQFIPTMIPDSQRQALTYSLLRSYQVNGMDKDAEGNPIPLDQLEKMAQNDAEELLQVRALIQILSPAALRVTSAATPYEAEWSDLIENSPDYFAAIKAWTDKHPDLSYVSVGKTFFDAGIKGPDGTYIQAPRIPASQFVDQLLKTPGIGDFMRNNMAWAGLVLVGIDPKVSEGEDFSTYSKLLSEGLLKYRPLDDFLAQGEQNKVSGIVDDWYTNVWDPKASNITDTSSPEYRDLIAQRSEFLAGLANQYPNWAATHLNVQGEGAAAVYSWPQGADKPVWYALAKARQIAATPGFENAPGFIALQKYLDIRDGIENQMRKDGLVDITLDPDLQNKLAKQTNALEQETPGIAPFISAYFGTSLNSDGTLRTADYTLQTLPQQYIKRIMNLPQDLRTDVVHTMTHYQDLRTNADRNYDYPWQESQNYQNAQSFFDHKYVNAPKTLNTWWNSYMTEKERAQYKADLATKPPVFYSAWDWHLQGVNLSKGSVDHLEQVAEWRIGIQKYQTENPQADDIGKRYEAIDHQVAQWAKGDKKFATVINDANSWSFGLRAAGYGNQGSNKKVDTYWGYILDLADGLQANVDQANRNGGDYHGTGGFDKKAAAGWRGQQDWLLSWVKYYQEDSPAFKRSWYDLQESTGGDALIGTIFMPDTYYRLGG